MHNNFEVDYSNSFLIKKCLVKYMISRNNSKNILIFFLSILLQDCLLMLYSHVTKFSTRAIINDSDNIFLTLHKISNLKMNTAIDFQLIFFCESKGLKELHIKYLGYVFFSISVRDVRLKIVYY